MRFRFASGVRHVICRSVSQAPSKPRRQVWMAKEYHDSDFDVKELAPEGQAYATRCAVLTQRASRAVREFAAAKAWDAFYSTHELKFFHPRYFTLRVFPELEQCSSILEVGCGNGSNLFPLLEKTTARVFGCDYSEVSLSALEQHDTVRQQADRLQLTQWDLSLPAPAALPAVDAALCMFVLSALDPADHLTALRNLRATLRPGGLLGFRDYGWLDLAQLRAPDAGILTPSLHRRPDGTLAYYFTVEEVRGLLETAGFTVLELKYACVVNVNKAKGVQMRRVFVHAKTRVREDAGAELLGFSAGDAAAGAR